MIAITGSRNKALLLKSETQTSKMSDVSGKSIPQGSEMSVSSLENSLCTWVLIWKNSYTVGAQHDAPF